MDLNFSPGDQVSGDMMAQADRDDLAGMIDAIGDDLPAVERSSIAIAASDDPNAPPKPLDQMTLEEQLQWQATRLKKPGAEKKAEAPAAPTDPDQPPKPLD